jgi:hypothetical protein
LNGPGTPAYVAGWAGRNGCDPTPTDSQISEEVIHRVYDCPAGADVEFYIVLGGGHTWPGSEFSRAIEPVVGHTTFDIHASEVAWAFFERFQLPCEPAAPCDEPEPESEPPDTAPPTTSPPPSPTPVAVSPAAIAPVDPAVQPAFTG